MSTHTQPSCHRNVCQEKQLSSAFCTAPFQADAAKANAGKARAGQNARWVCCRFLECDHILFRTATRSGEDPGSEKGWFLQPAKLPLNAGNTSTPGASTTPPATASRRNSGIAHRLPLLCSPLKALSSTPPRGWSLARLTPGDYSEPS